MFDKSSFLGWREFDVSLPPLAFRWIEHVFVIATDSVFAVHFPARLPGPEQRHSRSHARGSRLDPRPAKSPARRAGPTPARTPGLARQRGQAPSPGDAR